MLYFFPDSQDLVDPSFDFKNETRGITRLRQRDDHYPHEIFAEAPYDGILISRAIVDERYTLPQQQRLLRLGVREFLRITAERYKEMRVMGDCGAFNYKDLEIPPFTVDDVADFYERCGFDLGISVDHVILAFDLAYDAGKDVPQKYQDRQKLTLEYASDFFAKTRNRRVRFEPLGVAQGWSPLSYAASVVALQKIGYSYIAIGGLVPMKTPEILATLAAVRDVSNRKTRYHLLGVTRCESLADFHKAGVVSFDSTTPLLQAFKSDMHNYHTDTDRFVALRVPQVQGNPKLQAAILSGRVRQETARQLERDCLDLLVAFDRGEVSVDAVLEKLIAYEHLHAGKSRYNDPYRRVLEAKPWQDCRCEICSLLGIHVMLFRGAERNRRRGFHNLQVFYRKIRRLSAENTPRATAA